MINVENKLIELGFIVKRQITQGKVHRLATINKPNKKNGWVRLLDNSCSYGDWSGDIENGWFWLNYIEPMTAEQRQEYAKKRAEREELQRKIDEQDRVERMQRVAEGFAGTRQAKQHDYLKRKQINMRGDFRFDWQDRLVVPIHNIMGQLTGYQYIDSQGIKLFKSGSLPIGGFYKFMPDNCSLKDLDLIFVCEGMATAASVYQALNEHLDAVNYGVIATFSDGNVKHIVNSIRQHVGKKAMVGIMDNDKAGIKAFSDINIKKFIVHFLEGSDANDVYCNFGADALAELILTELNGGK